MNGAILPTMYMAYQRLSNRTPRFRFGRTGLLLLTWVLLWSAASLALATGSVLAAPPPVAPAAHAELESQTHALSLVVDGVAADDSRPALVGGTLLLPLQVFAEHLGVAVGWLKETNTVRLQRFNSVAYLRLGAKVGLVDGKSVELVQPLQVIGGRTMLPARLLSETFGFDLVYLPKRGLVKLTSADHSVSSVAFRISGGRPRVELAGAKVGAIKVRALTNPERLVVDLPGTYMATHQARMTTGNPLVKEVDITQPKPTEGRVTILLANALSYQTVSTLHGVELVFRPQILSASVVEANGQQRLVVKGTGPLTHTLRRLSGPDRLVLEFPGQTLAAPAKSDPSGSWVKRIRLSQVTPDTVRVVADLVGPLDCQELQNAAKPEVASVRLVNRVSGISFATIHDRTRVRITTIAPTTLTTEVDRDGSKLLITVPEANAADLPAEIPVHDGTVEVLRPVRTNDGRVVITVVLPYYVGHQVLPSTSPHEAWVEISRSPVYQKRIYLDPGHGGTDPGAIGPDGLMEKDVNLDVGLKLGELLRDAGAKVQLSRSTDVFVPLYDRPRQANSFGANIFVSIHSNANVSANDSGTETYYHPEHPFSRNLALAVQTRMISELGLLDRNIKQSFGLVVTRESSMPGILAEVAFVSNPTEEKLLSDPSFRGRVAHAIADGIFDFFRQGLALTPPPLVAPSTPAAVAPTPRLPAVSAAPIQPPPEVGPPAR